MRTRNRRYERGCDATSRTRFHFLQVPNEYNIFYLIGHACYLKAIYYYMSVANVFIAFYVSCER